MNGHGPVARLLRIGAVPAAEALIAVGLSLGAAAAALAVPWVGRSLIDEVQASTSSAALNRAFLWLAALWLLAGGFSLVRDVRVARLGHHVARSLRVKVFAHVLSLPASYFDHSNTGELIARLTTDVDNVRRTLADDAVRMIGDVVLVLGGAFLLLALDLRLTLWLAGIVLLLPVLHRLLSPRLRGVNRRAQDALAETLGRSSEVFANIRLVKTMGREGYESGVAARAQDRAADMAIQASRLEVTAWRALYTAFGLLGILILWLAVQRVRAGGVSLGAVLAYLYTLMIVYGPVTSLAGIAARTQRTLAAADRIFEILDEPAETVGEQGLQRLQPTVGKVVFRRVGFSYPGSTEVISDLDLTIPAGRTTAIVGVTGAGKSTLAALLQRLHEPSHGHIEIDGIPIAEASRESVRSALAVVTQETLLFDASIRDNIRYGRLDASDEEVERAARAAHVVEFAGRLPEGLETRIGERGALLSAGQRQRITIARALLRNAPILLMDEATSALDPESELLVQDAIRTLTRGRTTILIAHRPQTVATADRIVVLERGRLVAQGTHAELMAGESRYREIFSRQDE
jgi:ABC-type multidrug transport system fused ATPase/permease subunit